LGGWGGVRGQASPKNDRAKEERKQTERKKW
jgi:hypothetical protein